eukprot:g12039.t1
MEPFVTGKCHEGYQSVKRLFEQHFVDEVNEYAQLCVYVQGIKVIDLYGARPKKGSKSRFQYNETSLQNVFSSTKVLTSLVIAMLVDRGRLGYGQKVVEIWPEYGQCGKAGTTIAEVMRHEAGLPQLSTLIPARDLYTEAIKNGRISTLIEKEPPTFEPGSKMEYHALTRGWIINEIVRRVDKSGRTIGEFLRDEVALPLGIANELYIGTPVTEHHRIAPINAKLQTDYIFNLKNLALPRSLGGGRVPTEPFMLRLMLIFGLSFYALGLGLDTISKFFRRSSGKIYDTYIMVDELHSEEPPRIHVLFNHSEVRQGESPSANGHASARALAAVAASVVGGGKIRDGSYSLLSQNGCNEAQSGIVPRVWFDFPGLKFKTYFCNAGWNHFKHSRYGYTGWMGYGGSVCQWHNEEKIGIGFTVNLMELNLFNARAQELQLEILKCAMKLRGDLKSKL